MNSPISYIQQAYPLFSRNLTSFPYYFFSTDCSKGTIPTFPHNKIQRPVPLTRRGWWLMLLFLCRSDYSRQTQGSLPSAIYGVQISVRVSSAGTFLSLIEPEPNYDHVLFSIDNRYLIIQLVTQTRSRTIPTISGFREIHPGIIMLCSSACGCQVFIKPRFYTPSALPLSCRLWRI